MTLRKKSSSIYYYVGLPIALLIGIYSLYHDGPIPNARAYPGETVGSIKAYAEELGYKAECVDGAFTFEKDEYKDLSYTPAQFKVNDVDSMAYYMNVHIHNIHYIDVRAITYKYHFRTDSSHSVRYSLVYPYDANVLQSFWSDYERKAVW